MSFEKKRSFSPRMLFGGGGDRDWRPFFFFFSPLPDAQTCWGVENVTR